jgi:N-acylneuraminate cytidylyltransferase
MALRLGAEAPFLRPAALAAPGVPLEAVLQHCLEWLEGQEGYRPDVVVVLEPAHPIRPPNLVEEALETLMEQGLDTVLPVCEERHAFWRRDTYGDLRRVGEEDGTRLTRTPLYREVAGLALVTRAAFLRRGQRLGQRVGVVLVTESYALADTQDEVGLSLAGVLLRALAGKPS